MGKLKIQLNVMKNVIALIQIIHHKNYINGMHNIWNQKIMSMVWLRQINDINHAKQLLIYHSETIIFLDFNDERKKFKIEMMRITHEISDAIWFECVNYFVFTESHWIQ